MTSKPIDERPVAPANWFAILLHLATLPTPSLCLFAVIGLTFVDVFAGWGLAAFIACPFLGAYFVLLWSKLLANGRILLVACGVIAIFAATRPGAIAILQAGASRMIYLPAFVAILGFLRAAASASALIAVAGRHLVHQPPSLRYIALSFGGHFFGILLNIGGLALLVEMVRDANTLEAAGGDPNIVAWRERRMTVALMRGFAAIAFWSPLGVSFNLLLVSVPGVTWGSAGPIGMICAVAFIGLGWIFDQFQRPKGLRPRPIEHVPGGTRAVFVVILHVAAISAFTWAIEYLLQLSFQTALLLAVPAYAFLWAIGVRIARSDPHPAWSSAGIMIDRGLAAFPAYANEIAVFAASGFLGAALVALVPREALRAFFLSFALPPAIFAALLSVTIAALSFFGLNPMIAATILASAVASADIPGLSKVAIVLSISAGWACSVVASPVNSSLVMTSALIGQRPWKVSIGWNGPFVLVALVFTAVVLAVLLPF